MSRPTTRIARLEEAIALVTELIDFHEELYRLAAELGNRDGHREAQVNQKRRVGDCIALRDFLQSMLSKQRGEGLELLPQDLEGLPEELIAELSISDSDQQELEILKLIEAEGGAISLDLLLVRWYRAQKTVIKRKALTSRLYRMQQKGRIFAVEGTKGIYSLHKQEETAHDSPTQTSSE